MDEYEIEWIEWLEWIGTNDKGEPRHGKWRARNVIQWMKGMVEGYEGPNAMVSKNMEPRIMFQRSPYAPFQGYEKKRKYGGKGCMKMERWY